MKFVHRASQGLHTFIESDLASWVLVYAVAASSLAVALVLMKDQAYFPMG